MEAEICDLDELTGSALGDQPPISNSSLFLSRMLRAISVARLCFNCFKFRPALN